MPDRRRRGGIAVSFTPPPFSPSDISGLVLALDYQRQVFSDLAGTIPATLGQNVKFWGDTGPFGYHATEATNPPVLAADGLTFDGTNDVLRVTRMTGAFSAGFSYFVVASLVDGRPAATTHLFGARASAPTRNYFMDVVAQTSGTNLAEVAENAVTKQVVVNTFADGASAKFINAYTANPAGNFAGYFNGNAAGTPIDISGLTWANIATPVTEAPFIGCRNFDGSPQLYFAGAIVSVIIYNRSLSTSELTTVHRYLGAKYAITVP